MVAASLASISVGNDVYPLATQPRCKVCCHEARADIERAVAEGRTYTAIVRTLDLAPELSPRNIRDHINADHLPLQAAAVQQVARERSLEASLAAAPLIAGVAAHLSLAHAVVRRVGARLASGETQPTVRDGLAAARLIAEVEGVTTPEEEWTDFFSEVYEAARAVMTDHQFHTFHRRIGESDVIRRTSQPNPVS